MLRRCVVVVVFSLIVVVVVFRTVVVVDFGTVVVVLGTVVDVDVVRAGSVSGAKIDRPVFASTISCPASDGVNGQARPAASAAARMLEAPCVARVVLPTRWYAQPIGAQ